MRACVRACVRVCVCERACGRACMCVCACASVTSFSQVVQLQAYCRRTGVMLTACSVRVAVESR